MSSKELECQINRYQRCPIPTLSNTVTGGVDKGKTLYPQQHLIGTTKMSKNRNTLKPVLRKRLEYAFSTDSMRANNNRKHLPSWRKDGIKKRELLLREDEDNGGNDFVIDRQSNLKNYYAIAERVLHQFQLTCASSNKLEETYLMGNRLIKFLSDVLPKHHHYHSKDPSLSALRIKSQNDLVQVRNQVDEVALLIDKAQYRIIMEMEGMEGDFCPSPPSRCRNRKRVTFDLQEHSSPVTSPDRWNQNMVQGGEQSCDNTKNRNNEKKTFVWNNESTQTSNYCLERHHHITKSIQTSSRISLKDSSAENENENILSDAWESFDNACGAEWELEWPETFRADPAVVSSELPISFDGHGNPDQRSHACSYRYNSTDDDECSGNIGINKKDVSNGVVSPSISPTRITDKELDKIGSVDDKIFEMGTSLFAQSITKNDYENNFQALDENDVTLKDSKCVIGECSFDGSDEELEHQEYIEKMRELEFSADVPNPCHHNYGSEKTKTNFKTNVLDFCDDILSPCDSSGGDKTIATAETEAMTADDDSEMPLEKRGVADECPEECNSIFNRNQLPRKLAYLECKVKELENTSSRFNAIKSAADGCAETRGENNCENSCMLATLTPDKQDSGRTFLKAKEQSLCINSSNKTPFNEQNNLRVKQSETPKKIDLVTKPPQHQNYRNNSTSLITGEASNVQNNQGCNIKEKQLSGLRDSDIIKARRAKAAKLKKWRRRCANTKSSTK